MQMSGSKHRFVDVDDMLPHRPIPDYPGYYADIEGEIFHLKASGKFCHLRTKFIRRTLYTALYRNEKRINVPTARLVWTAWHPNRPIQPNMIIGHRSTITTDNNPNNLIMVTRAKYMIGRIGRHRKPVEAYHNGELVEVFPTIKACAEHFGYTAPAVYYRIKNKRVIY